MSKSNLENSMDKQLKIQTTGRDDSKEDTYHHPYEPTPYSVLERLAGSEYITRDNIFYVFRSKETVSQTASALGLTDRDRYYEAIKEQLNGEYGTELLLAMMKYLPELRLEE